MKVLIIGVLGAGKSSLAYELQKRLKLPRLNLDEVNRDPSNGKYRSSSQIKHLINQFLSQNKNWVMEGCQKEIYTLLNPDIIIYVCPHLWIAAKRFIFRFFQAKRLIGKNVNPSLPVQHYHYRPIRLQKIKEWHLCNKTLKKEFDLYLKTTHKPVIRVRSKNDYPSIIRMLKED